MPQWPIRVKLIAGLSLVVGMMLTLMGGSIFGLHAFHASNLTLVDQLRELGASKDLLESVVRLETPRRATRRGAAGAGGRSSDAQQAPGRLPHRAEEEHDPRQPGRRRPRRAGPGVRDRHTTWPRSSPSSNPQGQRRADPARHGDLPRAGTPRRRRCQDRRRGPRRADRPAEPPGHGPARQAPPRLLRDPA